MDSRVRFPQRKVIEENEIGALFPFAFYGHTPLNLVLLFPLQFLQVFLFVEVVGGRAGWLIFFSVFRL